MIRCTVLQQKKIKRQNLNGPSDQNEFRSTLQNLNTPVIDETIETL